MSRVLVISAHPDDAEIAMGGTIAKLAREGNQVLNLIISVPDKVDTRKLEAQRAAVILGIDVKICGYKFPCQVEDIPIYQLIPEIEGVIKDFRPDIVFCHWDQDSHQDHRLVAHAVVSTLRNEDFTLYFYEQVNQRNAVVANLFRPNLYVDISTTLETKLDAIKCYSSQLQGSMAHYVSDAQDLSSWRGLQIGVRYAESFKLVFKKEL